MALWCKYDDNLFDFKNFASGESVFCVRNGSNYLFVLIFIYTWSANSILFY